MAKGIYTQAVCLLTDGTPTIDQVRAGLRQHGFPVVWEPAAGENWAFGGPTVVVAYRPDANGYVAVDVVDRPWPDDMGDPKSDPMTFGAWTMGHFGPLAYPGGLGRAGRHAWAWPPAADVAAGHGGFIRARLSYAFGGDGGTPLFPDGYDPLAELTFLDRLTAALLGTPGVVCYYNPNGEVLRDRESFRAVADACVRERKSPLLLWANVRYFHLTPEFAFMDTVGNGQLDVPDVEAVFPSVKYDPGVVDYYLRNVTHYLLGRDHGLKTGEPIDGPGESDSAWVVEVLDQGVVDPPRPVVRLCPTADARAVHEILPAARSRR